MIKYLKDEKEYYKWCMNNKINYFVYYNGYTERGKYKLEFYPKKYNVKINQYTLDNEFLISWDNIIEPSKILKAEPECILTACKLGCGKYAGYRWEFSKGD